MLKETWEYAKGYVLMLKETWEHAKGYGLMLKEAWEHAKGYAKDPAALSSVSAALSSASASSSWTLPWCFHDSFMIYIVTSSIIVGYLWCDDYVCDDFHGFHENAENAKLVTNIMKTMKITQIAKTYVAKIAAKC